MTQEVIKEAKKRMEKVESDLRAELATLRTQSVQTAGGRREVWPVAEVRVAVDGREVTTPCFIAPDGPALLGAVALESLFLAADPVAKRLVPVEGFVG